MSVRNYMVKPWDLATALPCHVFVCVCVCVCGCMCVCVCVCVFACVCALAPCTSCLACSLFSLLRSLLHSFCFLLWQLLTHMHLALPAIRGLCQPCLLLTALDSHAFGSACHSWAWSAMLVETSIASCAFYPACGSWLMANHGLEMVD